MHLASNPPLDYEFLLTLSTKDELTKRGVLLGDRLKLLRSASSESGLDLLQRPPIRDTLAGVQELTVWLLLSSDMTSYKWS